MKQVIPVVAAVLAVTPLYFLPDRTPASPSESADLVEGAQPEVIFPAGQPVGPDAWGELIGEEQERTQSRPLRSNRYTSRDWLRILMNTPSSIVLRRIKQARCSAFEALHSCCRAEDTNVSRASVVFEWVG